GARETGGRVLVHTVLDVRAVAPVEGELVALAGHGACAPHELGPVFVGCGGLQDPMRASVVAHEQVEGALHMEEVLGEGGRGGEGMDEALGGRGGGSCV